MVFSVLPRFVSLELKNKLFKHQVFYKSVGKPDAFVCSSSDVKNTPVPPGEEKASAVKKKASGKKGSNFMVEWE